MTIAGNIGGGGMTQGRPNGTTRQPLAATEDQFNKLQEFLLRVSKSRKDSMRSRNVIAVEMAYMDGLKITEIIGLTYADVYDQHKIPKQEILVGPQKRKVKLETRTIQLLKYHIAYLTNDFGMIQDDFPLFFSQKGPAGKASNSFLHRIINTKFSAIGLPHHTTQSLRNGYILRKHQQEKSIRHIARQLGESREKRIQELIEKLLS